MEAARLLKARVLQTGSLSNLALTWGLIYPLRFHKTELEDLCVKKKIFKKKSLFKKKKEKTFRQYCVQIREILVPSFLNLVLTEMFEPVFRLEYHFLSFVNSILAFKKKSDLVSFSRMQFVTFVPSSASTPFRVYCIRDRHICISNLLSF